VKDENGLCPEEYFGCFETIFTDEEVTEERTKYETCVPHDEDLEALYEEDYD